MGEQVVGQPGGAPQFKALALVLGDHRRVIRNFHGAVGHLCGPVLKLQVLHPGGEAGEFAPLGIVQFSFHRQQRIDLLAVCALFNPNTLQWCHNNPYRNITIS